MNITRSEDHIVEHTTTEPINYDNINTHENAIEVLIIVAEQQLNRAKAQYRHTVTSELETKIMILERTIAFAYDYLQADGYFRDPDRGLHRKE